MKKNIFNTIQLPKVSSNVFDLSHDHKFSMRMGQLVPSCVIETNPGDIFDINVANFLRFAPLISPVMHKVRVTTHFYFVPYRILWSNWEKFITGGEDGASNNAVPFINMTPSSFPQQGSIADYMGLPAGLDVPATTIPVSALPFAAYFKIFDEYYRDQNNAPDTKFVPLIDGDNTDDYADVFTERPLLRAWMHDYFTSALPFAQKGDDVQVPLTVQDNIPVDFTTIGPGQPADQTPLWRNPFNGVQSAEEGTIVSRTTAQNDSEVTIDTTTTDSRIAYDPNGSLTVDVQGGATDINTLRRAFRLQEWLERNARAGSRYIETILSHFGVRSSDSRLQRPEYIGGAYQNMVISEVLATAQDLSSGNEVPVGGLAGHGISAGGSGRFKFRCEEHGVIIGIINVQPDTAYQQGIHRMYSRFDKLDFVWPIFANIGEQEILAKELYVGADDPNKTFGYIPRFSEMRFLNSRVSGDFRTNLSFWHLGRIFENEPQLNEEFISCDPSTRIFAFEGDADHIYAQVFNNIRAVRKLPRFGIPSI